jgi:3-deoxy-D-manno-octulosonic-acid transferase
MNLLYRLLFFLIPVILKALKPFSGKLSHFLDGRADLLEKLKHFRSTAPGPLVWVHVSSHGEYEQARPVIASYKSHRPDHRIVVSFFSPSGFDHVSKRPQPHVDYITYLPLDRKSWAAEFVGILRPDVAFFVKYDLWFHHIAALKKKGIPVFLIAASLRPDQSFFGIFGAFFRQNLEAMDWIFTQNNESLDLLEGIGITHASMSGDTRFDRVAETAKSPKSLPDIKTWIGSSSVTVIGSAWEEDMRLLIPLINSRPDSLWIIAPHDLSPEPMHRWAAQIQAESQFYSAWDPAKPSTVLFIDNIGMLSSIYQFAKVAYVGGAFGKGLHNILEPLGFGVPVIFGKVKKVSKFPEAAQSQQEGCGFSVEDQASLFETVEKLEDPEFYAKAVHMAQKWVSTNLGAADRIVEKIIHFVPQK